MRFTTQKAALCSALLDGEVLTIMEAFTRFGITNLPREIGRSIERPFGIYMKRRRVNSKNKYGECCSHFIYWLPKQLHWQAWNDRNKLKIHKAGLKLMQKYVDEHTVKIKKSKYNGGGLDSAISIDAIGLYPHVPYNKTAAEYARQAAERVIPRCGKTTAEIVRDSIFTKEQIAEQKRKKK